MSVIESSRVLAIVRFRSEGDVEATLDALDAGGIGLSEVTIDTPGALDAVERSAAKGRTVGVGTVVTAEQVRACADAGARFVVTPGTVDEVIAEALDRGLEPIAGAFTATEILRALALGVKAVKLFPASTGGPAYVRALRGPFPTTPFVPTGGIAIKEVQGYLEAGATCVGLGGELVGRTPPHGDGELKRVAARAAAVARVAASP
ncbi:MAG TPA: bifunctional 4-hydroxy-2-oxoglutarate aldolase/2-dehydro-3-deoxy-phosphogluconate aldolase [Actinomycetota bacterium]|jgi:2-dehydro-3-deoxyphosphogluconate aldolase/(4S)-4-hydroxy-2-oxoglutarate aldolase